VGDEDASLDRGHAEDLDGRQTAESPRMCSLEVDVRGAPQHGGRKDLAEVGFRLEADRHQELGTARRAAASF
jgi:hypothetical protein